MEKTILLSLVGAVVWSAAGISKVWKPLEASYTMSRLGKAPSLLFTAEAHETPKAPQSQHPLENTQKKADDGLVFVKGGTFKMGCVGDQTLCGEDETPVHRVKLKSFYIGRCEVTQKQWREVMGDNPATSSRSCDTCPVEQVSWEEVQVFLQKLNQQTGRQYRLPTEAEWEYAAKGGRQDKGYSYSGGQEIGPLACYYGNSGRQTRAVGQLKANQLGLYDLSGNVWEWCSDWYASGYYQNSPPENPTGPATGTNRVCRGGSWGSIPTSCRVSYRYSYGPGNKYSFLGFRLARTP